MVAIYPLEYTRTRLANSLPSLSTGQPRFSGIVNTINKTIATEGIRGIYRGFLASCLGVAAYRGFYFGFYDNARVLFPLMGSNFLFKFAVGQMVVITAELFTYPLDTICRRLMMSSCEEHKFKGMLSCTTNIMR